MATLTSAILGTYDFGHLCSAGPVATERKLDLHTRRLALDLRGGVGEEIDLTRSAVWPKHRVAAVAELDLACGIVAEVDGLCRPVPPAKRANCLIWDGKRPMSFRFTVVGRLGVHPVFLPWANSS